MAHFAQNFTLYIKNTPNHTQHVENTRKRHAQNGAPRAPVELQVEPLPIRVMQEALEARSASPYTLHTETPPSEPIALKIGILALPTLT